MEELGNRSSFVFSGWSRAKSRSYWDNQENLSQATTASPQYPSHASFPNSHGQLGSHGAPDLRGEMDLILKADRYTITKRGTGLDLGWGSTPGRRSST